MMNESYAILWKGAVIYFLKTDYRMNKLKKYKININQVNRLIFIQGSSEHLFVEIIFIDITVTANIIIITGP
jgi:hypothetical protein